MQDFPQPPIDPPESPCLWCDGTRKVWVHSIVTPLGVPERIWGNQDCEIDCPRCDTGEEPKPDPLDDPRIP